MKRLLVVLGLLAVLLSPSLLLTGQVQAEVDVLQTCNIPTADGSLPEVCKDVEAQKQADTNPIIDLMRVALNILAIIAGIGAVLLIIINGLRLIVSNGDANGVKNARSGLIYALIGVVIVLMAQIIVVFVLDKVK